MPHSERSANHFIATVVKSSVSTAPYVRVHDDRLKGYGVSNFIIPQYVNDFSTSVKLIVDAVESTLHSKPDDPINFDSFQDCVYLKLSSRVLAHVNGAYQQFFSSDPAVVSGVGEQFLDSNTLEISAKSDELLISGGQSIEFEHWSVGCDGQTYLMRSHKRWLKPNARHLSILGITRVLEKTQQSSTMTNEKKLEVLLKKYQLLDKEDRCLCRLMTEGHSQKEMAELLACSTRTIENRRNRIMEQLGAEKPIDIVKLIVRLIEHDLIPTEY